MIFDENGKAVDILYLTENSGAVRMLGQSFVGKRLREISPLYEDYWYKIWGDVALTGISTKQEQYSQADGKWFDFFLSKVEGTERQVVVLFRDITERKKQEEALRKSEEKFRTVFETIDEGFCIIEFVDDAEGRAVDFRMVEVNKAYERASGLKDVTGKLLSEIAPGNDRYWIDFYDGVARTGVPAQKEDYSTPLDRWFATNVTRIGGPESRRVAIVFEDVTERRQREQLQEFLLKLSDALRPLSDPLQIQRTATRIVGETLQVDCVFYGEISDDGEIIHIAENYARSGTSKIIGALPLQKFGSKKLLEKGESLFIDDQNTTTLKTEAERAASIKMGVLASATIPLVKEGTWIAALGLVHSTPRKWKQQEILILQETAERTWAAVERAKAEEALRKSEEYLRQATDVSDIYSWEFDFKTGVVRLSENAERVIGRKPFGSFEENLLLTHPDDRELAAKAFEVALNDGTDLFNYTVRSIAAPEEVRWIHVSGKILRDANGMPVTAIGISQNVTERKRREQQQEFLLRFSDSLRAERTTDAVARRALEMLIEYLRLDRSYIVSYYLDKHIALLDYQIGNETAPPLPDSFDLSQYPEAYKTVLDQTLVIEDDFERQGLSEEEKQNSAKLGMRAMLAATVRKGENMPLWSMMAINSKPRRWTPDEVQLVEDVAERTWTAMERAKAEEALRRSEEKYRTLFNSVDEGYLLAEVIFDNNNKPIDIFYIQVNPAAIRLAGRDFSGQYMRTIDPRYEEYWYQVYGQVALTGEAVRDERYVEQHGKWFEYNITKMGGPDSRFIATVFQDITERKKAEEALRKSESRLAQDLADAKLLQQFSNEVIHLDELNEVYGMLLDTAMKLMQSDFASIQQYSTLTETLTLTAHRNFHPQSAEFWSTVSAGTGSVCGEALRHRSRIMVEDVEAEEFAKGELGIFRLSGIRAVQSTPIHSTNGKLIGMLNTQWKQPRNFSDDNFRFFDVLVRQAADFIERKQAEEALAKSEEKFRLLFNSIDQGFCIIELLYDENGKAVDYRWLEANPMYEKHSGIKNPAGKAGSEILPATEKYWLQNYDNVLKTGEASHFENWHESTGHWYHTYASRIGDKNSRQIAVVFADITERKQRELSTALLSEIGKDLSLLNTAKEMMYAVGVKLTGFLQLTGCVLTDVNEEKGEVTAHYGFTEGVALLEQTYVLDEYVTPEFQRACKAGEAFIVHDTQTDDRLNAEGYARLGIGALVVIPFLHKGEWTNYIGVTSAEPRQWKEADIALLWEVAERLFSRLERARAEEALRKSEAKFRRLSDSGLVAVAFFDIAGPIVDANEAFLNMLGVSREELQTEKVRWDVYTPKEWIPRTLEAIEEFKKTGYISPYEKQFYHSSGELRWGLFAGATLEDGHTGVSLVVDLTERKRAEEVQRQSEAQITAIFKALPMGIGFMNTKGQMLLSNEEMRRYLPNNIMPSLDDHRYKLWRAWHPDGTLVERADFPGLHALQGEYVVPGMEMLYTPQDSPDIWTRVAAVPMKDQDENTIGVVVVITDITKLKQAENALRTSEERLQKVLSIETVGVIYFDLDGVIHDANTAFERMSGYSKDDIKNGKVRLDELTTPEFMEVTLKSREELITAGQNTPYEKQNIRPDGTRWWGLFAGKRLSENEYVKFVVDITDRKEVDEKLKQFNELLEQQVTERTLDLQLSRDLLQSVFDTTLLSYSILKAVRDKNGTITDFKVALVNKELERETGRTDLVGKLYSEEYPGIKQAGLFDLMLRVMETGEPGQIEYYYPHENFNKWYSAMFVKLDDGLVASNLDITERKLAEAELTRNFTILKQAEEVAGMGSWEFDYTNNSFHWSEGMYHLFGLPFGVAKSPEIYLDYVIKENRTLAEKLVQIIRNNPQPIEETLRILINQQVKTIKVKAIVLRDDLNRPHKMLGVDIDVSELKRLEQENLQMRLDQQKALLLAILEAQEEERRRISESLHNGVGQILYATKLNLDQLAQQVPKEIVASTDKLLSKAIQQTRSISHELVPMVLKDFGLPKAIEELCRNYEPSSLEVTCEVDLEGPLESYLELALYRISQELLTNVVKHAQATKAELLLMQEEGQIILKVRDNGKGILPKSGQAKGIGLRTIADRVKLLNGTFTLSTPSSGKGTLVVIQLPIPS